MDDIYSLYDIDGDDIDTSADDIDDIDDTSADDESPTTSPPAVDESRPAPAADAVSSDMPEPTTAPLIRALVSSSGFHRVATLPALLPPLPEQGKPTRSPKTASSHTPTATAGDDGPGDDERAGTRLARTAPISEVLPLLGWTCARETADGGSQWYRPDHSGQSGHDLTVYPATDTEPEKATAFGAHAQADWGLDGQDHSWSTWDLVGNVYCAGDWKLAARIAASYTTPAELVELLQAYPTPGQLAAAVPPASNVEEILAQPLLSEALEANNGTRIDLGNDLVVYVGGLKHGIWMSELHGRGENIDRVERQITDWIVYRSRMHKPACIGRDNRPVDLEERFELELIRADGRHFPTRQMDFGVKESTSIETIQFFIAGVQFPVKLEDRKVVENVMNTLGLDEIPKEYVWTSTGWVLLPDGQDGTRAVFLAPNGSITSAGVDPGPVVGPPPHSEEGSLKVSQELLGWNGTVDDPASTVEAVRAFIATAPKRPEIPIALLGGIFAAPLRMKNRAAIGLNGEPGSNKSILSAAAYSFYSAHLVSKEALPLTISGGSSVAGARAQLGWHRDIVLFADDYKKGNTRTDDGKKWDAIMRLLVQTAYDGQSGDMGTQGGGLRANQSSTATLVFSGELILPEASILQRCVSLQVAPGDIDAAGDDNAYDVFRSDYGNTGVARGFCGSYLKFLCGEIDAHDGALGWLSYTANRDFDECFQHYLKVQQRLLGAIDRGNTEIRRAAETAAVIAVGWRWARRFAERHGFADKLPSEQEIEDAILNILGSNTVEQTAADYGLKVIATAAEMLAANSGHLLMHDGSRPMLENGSPGWLMTQTPTGEPRWDPKGPLLGYVSMDHRHILLVNDALRTIQRAANLDGLETSQIKRALAKHVVAGTIPGDKSPLDMFNRRRGFVIDLGKLDLSPAAETAHAAQEDDEDF